MKLLSVANVGTLLGGTGACCYSCVKSLPDWQHAVVFLSTVEDFTRQQFGCEVRQETRITQQLIDEVKPDVILFHNTSPDRFPERLPDDCVAVYYQHSAFHSCREARRRCDVSLAVSHHLARQTNLRQDFILYQPVPKPPAGERRAVLTFGRICTPNRMKWRGVDRFYSKLGSSLDSLEFVFGDPVTARWDFVGAPDDFPEHARFSGEFHPAAWDARRLLSEWTAMLYHHPTVSESYGRTVCEAQRAGCIPIVDRRGGFVEQIGHGKTGFLCDSVNEFAEAVRTVAKGEHSIDIAAMQKAADERGSLAAWRRNFLAWVESASVASLRSRLPA